MFNRITNFSYAVRDVVGFAFKRIRRDSFIQEAVKDVLKFAKVRFSNLAYDTIAVRKIYEGPAFKYGFGDIERFYRNDSYTRKALDRYTEMIFKAGFILDGPNDLIKYIKFRLNIMVKHSGEDLETFLEGIADDLTKYHNCFLYRVKYQEKMVSLDKYRLKDEEQGVDAYYMRIEPSTVIIERDASGKVKGYSQTIKDANGNFPKFKSWDIIHIYKDKAAGSAFGFPFMEAAIDDIRALRKVEEQVLKLIHRWTHPLYHYIIGDDRLVGQEYEIEDAKTNLEEAGTDEMIFTNNRHKIQAIGAESTALRVQSYLDYFEKRVFTALGVPPQLLNRSAQGIASSDMVIAFYDTIKAYQKVLADSIKLQIFDKWITELGFDLTKDWEKAVTIKFNEIDVDTQTKKINMLRENWVANILTEDEVRAELGLKPMKDADREKTYNYLVKIPLAGMGAGVIPDYLLDGANTQVEPPTTVKPKALPKNKPKALPAGEEPEEEETETETETETESIVKESSNASVLYQQLLDQLDYHWAITQKDVIEYYKDLKVERDSKAIDNSLGILFKLAKDSMLKESKKYIRHSILEGMGYKKSEYLLSAYVVDYVFGYRAEKIINNLLEEVKAKTKEQINTFRDDKNVVANVVGLFSSRRYKLKMFADREVRKAKNYGSLLNIRAGGTKEFIISSEKGCALCKSWHGKKIDIDKVSFDSIPPFHSQCCECKIEPFV